MCLVRQLLCLYPFPQRSHLSSVVDRFPSPLTRCEPSLARRLRFLVLTGLVVVEVPSRAPLGEFLRSLPPRPIYDPKFEEAPTEVDSAPRRELRPLRCDVAGLVPSCLFSLRTAAAAAAAAANSASAAAIASSLSASSSFIPSIVFRHPAGLIHEHPNDAILFLRARKARSSNISVASVSPVLASALAPPCAAELAPVRYCAVPWRRTAWAWPAEAEDEAGSEDWEKEVVRGANQRSCDF